MQMIFFLILEFQLFPFLPDIPVPTPFNKLFFSVNILLTQTHKLIKIKTIKGVTANV